MPPAAGEPERKRPRHESLDSDGCVDGADGWRAPVAPEVCQQASDLDREALNPVAGPCEPAVSCDVALEPCARQDAKTAAQIRIELVLLLGKEAAGRLLATYQAKPLRDGRGGVQRFLVDSAGVTLTLAHRKNVATE